MTKNFSGTAQIFLLFNNFDTVIHLINIPFYYSKKYSMKRKNNRSFKFDWYLSIFDSKGNLVLRKTIDFNNTFSKSISLRNLLDNESVENPYYGQFVISHSSEENYYCQFYTSFIENYKKSMNSVFKLHSHQEITLQNNIYKSKSIKNVLYKIKRKVFNLKRYSRALTSWSFNDIHEGLLDSYFYIAMANHGDSLEPSYFKVEIYDRNNNFLKDIIHKIVAPKFGTSITNISKFLKEEEIGKINKIVFSFKSSGTMSKKPILLISPTKIDDQKNQIINLSVKHLQHT